MVDKKHTTAEIVSLCGLSSGTLREWRRLGLLDGVGILQENYRWVYDGADTELLVAMATLANFDITRKLARQLFDAGLYDDLMAVLSRLPIVA